MENWKNGQLIGTEPDPEHEDDALPISPSIEEQILSLQNALITSKNIGGGTTVITDSSDNRIKRFELTGNTEQVQTVGKNLFNVPIIDADSPDFIINCDIEKNIVISFQERPISITGSHWRMSFKRKDASYRYATDDQFPKMVDVTSENPIIQITIRSQGIEKGQYVGCQIEYGNTATQYEPYTGGKPSPSPEYPQEIKSVGKWNEEKQKYEISVKVIGKNLLDLQKEPDVKGIYQGWKVGDGENITLSIKDRGNNADIKGCFLGLSGNGVSSQEGVVWVVNNGVPSMNITDKRAYVTIFPDNKTATEKLVERFAIQCEHGAIATSYQPFREQTLTIASDRLITKWDKLVEQDGQIGWLYKSKVYDGFDGQSNQINNGGKQGEVQHFTINFMNIPKGNGNKDIYVNKYRAVSTSYTKSEYGICCNWNDGIKYFSAPNKDITTIEEFKAWLIENPLYLAYETLETEFVPLSQSEQDAIRALMTYYPTTVITTDGGEVDPNVEVTYTADTKLYIDQRIESIINTLVNTPVVVPNIPT